MEDCDLNSLERSTGARLSARPQHILAVGGAVAARRLTKTLAACGIKNVSVAGDIAEALELRRSRRVIDLIVCGLMRPGSAGWALIAKLRAKGERAPILVLLPKPEFKPLAEALAAGADDFLLESAGTAELRQAISALIARTAERERADGSLCTAPLHGATVSVEQHADGPALVMSAPTNSAQLESFLRFGERLVAGELPSAEQMHLHLALEEIVQNAKEWGNQFDPAKNIRVACSLKPDRIVFSIEDEGEGFDPSTVPDPSIDPKAHIMRRIASGKRIGGWGLFIAKKRMDEVVFNEKGTGVRMSKLFTSALEGS